MNIIPYIVFVWYYLSILLYAIYYNNAISDHFKLSAAYEATDFIRLINTNKNNAMEQSYTNERIKSEPVKTDDRLRQANNECFFKGDCSYLYSCFNKVIAPMHLIGILMNKQSVIDMNQLTKTISFTEKIDINNKLENRFAIVTKIPNIDNTNKENLTTVNNDIYELLNDLEINKNQIVQVRLIKDGLKTIQLVIQEEERLLNAVIKIDNQTLVIFVKGKLTKVNKVDKWKLIMIPYLINEKMKIINVATKDIHFKTTNAQIEEIKTIYQEQMHNRGTLVILIKDNKA